MHRTAEWTFIRVEQRDKRGRIGMERRREADANTAPEKRVEPEGDGIERAAGDLRDGAIGEGGGHAPSPRHSLTSRAIAGPA